MVDQQNLAEVVLVGRQTWSVVGHIALVGAGEIDDEGTKAKVE